MNKWNNVKQVIRLFKWNYNYKFEKVNQKEVYSFINHKISCLCWAKLKEKYGILDVIGFDSHLDFKCGMIVELNEVNLFYDNILVKNKSILESKNELFNNWNLCSDKENKEIFNKELFFTTGNDNFFDIAFLKNIIKNANVYFNYDLSSNYYYKNGKNEKLNNHNFNYDKISNFVQPKEDFILDIDLDFFVEKIESKNLLINNYEKYINKLKNLFNNEKCKGICIALEPTFFYNEIDFKKIINSFKKNLNINLYWFLEDYNLI
jgi:hypothetical protein